MSVSQASETEKMQMKISSDKQSKNGDEQVEGMGVSDQPSEEFTDPAILVIRETRKICYSKDALLKLREHPLSKKKPDFVDPSEVSPSIWDPERWGFERKKSDTPIENGPRSGGDGPSEHRRRPGDPRERIRKENDGIVLSPQRRSFNSGCFVPVRVDATRSNRSHSPLGPKTEGSHMGIREIQSNTRRIGSGRILRDSWDFNDKLDAGDNEYSYRGQQRNNNDRDDKYERRSFGRDFDMTRDRENNNKDSRRMSKGYERRRISENREQEEPEWFSGGPLSQNDTIELRGFDDEKPSRKKLSPSNMKRTKDVKKKSEPIPAQNNSEEKKVEENVALPEPTAAPSSQVGDQNENNEKTENVRKEEEKDNKVDNIEKTDEESRVSALVNDHSFNFEDILKCDSIPGLLTNGVGGDGDNTKSRFSQWFRKESPEKQESRRSSLHEDHIIKHLLKDIGETSVTIPGDSEAYFAPISPAANTGVTMGGKREFQQQSQPINIMDILQRGKQQPDPMKQSVPGKILSLDELEAKIRQNVEASTGISTKHQQQKPDEDMTAAFKKLLEQAQTGGHPAAMNPSLNKTQPMSLLEMLNHSQQQDEAARLSGANPHLLGPTNSNMAGMQHHQHVPNDLTMKLQQAQLQQQKQQMDMLNKLINATTSVHPQQLRASPLQDLVMQQSRDLLNRPEAQAILQGLKRGEITTQHLYQQLANPALQPRHRDMLMAILKVHGGGGFGPSPRVLSPVPPHHMFQQQQQQQLRVSPLPPNAMHQRIPSPRELQVHTQNILQRALIKKKLEEQQENYRKKQELQRGQSPNNSANQAPTKNVTSPTPLAFTPTSVLRKMTADKDEGKENKVNIEGKVPQGRALTGMRAPQTQGQWNPNVQYMSTKHPGRPIVKANNNFQVSMTDQFFGQQAPQPQQQQQQQVMQQQRAQQQQLAYQQQQQQQQQQRKVLTPQVMGPQFTSNQGVPQSQYNPQQYSTNQQFTQQQLRAQHQHRPANQQQSAQQHQQMAYQQQQSNQQNMGGGSWQPFFSNSHPANRNTKTGLESDGGRLTSNATSSTTTVNDLARWFPPELLERARGGELPSTAGLSQHVLSLEDIERQTAPPVHN